MLHTAVASGTFFPHTDGAVCGPELGSRQSTFFLSASGAIHQLHDENVGNGFRAASRGRVGGDTGKNTSTAQAITVCLQPSNM